MKERRLTIWDIIIGGASWAIVYTGILVLWHAAGLRMTFEVGMAALAMGAVAFFLATK